MTMERSRSEADIDGTLEASFPASDPPSWTLGGQPLAPRNSAVTMVVAKVEAIWSGTLQEGAGTMHGSSGFLQGAYTYSSHSQGDAGGTNPEELIGAAHAGCFSMFLAAQLSAAGFTPKHIRTTARVHLGAGATIAGIDLATEAEVPGLDEKTFLENVDASKRDCLVSKALSAIPLITVSARLV